MLADQRGREGRVSPFALMTATDRLVDAHPDDPAAVAIALLDLEATDE